MLEPLLGQHAPAVDDLPAALDVRSLCHEKVRKEENGRQRNGTNQLLAVSDILWKTFMLSREGADSGGAFDRNGGECSVRVTAADIAHASRQHRLPLAPGCRAVDEQAAAGDHLFARLQIARHLDQIVLAEAGPDLSKLDRPVLM